MEERHGLHRWTVLCAAVGTHLLLGTVYAWSVYAAELEVSHGFSRLATQAVFGVTIASFTVAMLVAGRLIARLGARRLLRTAAVLYGSGYAISALGSASVSATMVGIGVVSGMAIGIGYVSALASAVAVFESARGRVTGVVTAGFAAGSAVLAPLVSMAIEHGVPVPAAFAGQGTLGFIGLMLSASSIGRGSGGDSLLANHTPTRPERAPLIFDAVGIFATSFAGLLVIGGLASITTGDGRSAGVGSLAVVLFALGNTLGRPIWGVLHDHYGEATPPVAMSLLGLAVAALVPGRLSDVATLVVCFAIGLGFSSAFVLYAANTMRRCGVGGFAIFYPRVFLAYGLAALLGPPLGGVSAELFGSSRGAMLIAASVAFGGAGLLGVNECRKHRGGRDRTRQGPISGAKAPGWPPAKVRVDRRNAVD